MKKGQTRFDQWVKPEIIDGELTKWHWKVIGLKNFVMGDRVDIGAFTVIVAHAGVNLGDNVQIGGNCSIYSVNSEDGTSAPVNIMNGACVGAGSVIFPGVTIGENAKVGALTLVNKDIPAGATAVGIPARIIKTRD